MIAALLSYLPALLLTLALECTLVAASAPRELRRPAVRACLALNLLTHPLTTLLSWRGHADPILLELLAFTFEWFGYSQLLPVSSARALRIALLANLCSALAGTVLWMLRMG